MAAKRSEEEGRVFVRIDPALRRRLRMHSAEYGISQTDIVQRALREWLDETTKGKTNAKRKR